MDDERGIPAGPWGRVLRLLAGIALTVEGGRHLMGASGSLVATTLGVVVGVFSFYAVLHLIVWRFFRGVNPWLGAVLAAVPVVTVFLLGDAPGRLGTLLFVGVSLLFTAARAEGGCEVMTLPGMLFGRRTHLPCIAFSPIDWVETSVAGRHSAVEKTRG